MQNNELNYQRSGGGKPLFEKSLVLFLDVLGTSEAAKGPNAATLLEQLDEALERARGNAALEYQNLWESAWFSDNLVVATPLREGYMEMSVAATLQAAAWVQSSLANDGIFGRGGVAIGDHFMDGSTNFGPALVDAVALERQADVPRVLIDPAVIDLIREHQGWESFDELIWTEGASFFVNYLGMIDWFDDADKAISMKKHRDQIVKALQGYANNAKILAKYEWLAGYHDAFCKARPEPEIQALTVSYSGRAFLPLR